MVKSVQPTGFIIDDESLNVAYIDVATRLAAGQTCARFSPAWNRSVVSWRIRRSTPACIVTQLENAPEYLLSPYHPRVREPGFTSTTDARRIWIREDEAFLSLTGVLRASSVLSNERSRVIPVFTGAFHDKETT